VNALNRSPGLFLASISLLLLVGCATPPPLDVPRLATELARRPVVLLGEVHDNVGQHRVRAEALKRLLESGVRPAIAFEQFDRDRQSEIDLARRESPASGGSLADHVIERGRTPKDGWDWKQYRPFVELALQYDLPIVAANLSRATASRVAREGGAAAFGEDEQRELALGQFDDILPEQQRIVQIGHCNLLPESALPGLARAQIARDAVLARSLGPYLDRGVVLLTGNGHARRDIGVPRHLTPEQRGRTWSIGLLEEGAGDRAAYYDAAFLTPEQSRTDPCAALQRRPG